MSLNECASCDHINPVNAKFCNACGAALPTRPWVGELPSDILSAARAARGIPLPEAQPPAPSSSPGLAVAFASPDPLVDGQEPIAYSVQFDRDQTVRIGCVYGSENSLAAANSDFGPGGAESRRPGHELQLHGSQTPESMALSTELAGSGSAQPGTGELSLVLQALRRRPTVALVCAAGLTALATLAYVGYQQRSVPDISVSTSVNREPNERSEPAATATSLRRSSGDIGEVAPAAGVAGLSAPAGFAADGAVVNPAPPALRPQDEAARAAVANKDSRAQATLPATAIRTATAPVVLPRFTARAPMPSTTAAGRESALSLEAAAAVAAARAATVTNPVASPRLGPCTEGVAALGLCTPDPTQRKP
jgi:hypothetical protein